eukprot:SAG25_NODE_45_length_19261_cov_61.009815_17_plen_313_part_00
MQPPAAQKVNISRYMMASLLLFGISGVILFAGMNNPVLQLLYAAELPGITVPAAADAPSTTSRPAAPAGPTIVSTGAVFRHSGVSGTGNRSAAHVRLGEPQLSKQQPKSDKNAQETQNDQENQQKRQTKKEQRKQQQQQQQPPPAPPPPPRQPPSQDLMASTLLLPPVSVAEEDEKAGLPSRELVKVDPDVLDGFSRQSSYPFITGDGFRALCPWRCEGSLPKSRIVLKGKLKLCNFAAQDVAAGDCVYIATTDISSWQTTTTYMHAFDALRPFIKNPYVGAIASTIVLCFSSFQMHWLVADCFLLPLWIIY